MKSKSIKNAILLMASATMVLSVELAPKAMEMPELQLLRAPLLPQLQVHRLSHRHL